MSEKERCQGFEREKTDLYSISDSGSNEVGRKDQRGATCTRQRVNNRPVVRSVAGTMFSTDSMYAGKD